MTEAAPPSLPLPFPFLPSPRGNISKNDFSIWACRGGKRSELSEGWRVREKEKGGREDMESFHTYGTWYGKSMEGGGDGGVGGEIRNFIPIHRPRRGGMVGWKRKGPFGS